MKLHVLTPEPESGTWLKRLAALNPFRTMPAAELVRRQLETAERRWVEAQSKRDYYAGVAQIAAKDIRRLSSIRRDNGIPL
jgi:hypothetical protein